MYDFDKEEIMQKNVELIDKFNAIHLLFKDFDSIIINILNGSNTWYKTKKCFMLNGYKYKVLYKEDAVSHGHIPFKLSFDEFVFTNLLINAPLTTEQRKILLKAFLTVSNIQPSFLTQELKEELKLIDLTPFAPMQNLKNIVTFSKMDESNKEDIEDILEISIGEKVGIEEYVNPIKLVDFAEKFIENTSLKPYFKLKNFSTKNKENKEINSLVLWDIENVNYYGDVAEITSKIKSENQLKIVSYYRKNKADKTLFYMGDIYNKLRNLRKKNWIVKTSKDEADAVIIDNYNKYKNTLKELILITSDSDFLEIIKDSMSLNIKVKILNNSNFKTKKWFEDFDYEKLNQAKDKE